MNGGKYCPGWVYMAVTAFRTAVVCSTRNKEAYASSVENGVWGWLPLSFSGPNATVRRLHVED